MQWDILQQLRLIIQNSRILLVISSHKQKSNKTFAFRNKTVFMQFNAFLFNMLYIVTKIDRYFPVYNQYTNLNSKKIQFNRKKKKCAKK
jgi:hypothetical protein